MLQHIDKLRAYFNSNARNPAPKNFWEVFCAYLWLFLVVSTRFHLLFGTLKTTASACSAPVCGNQCGQKRFLSKASGSWPPPDCSRVTQSRATAQRRLLLSVYPEPADYQKTFCGTSNRSNESYPLQNGLSPHAPTHRHTLHRQSAGGFLPCDEWRACAAHDSNCGFCSIVITP